MLQLDRYKRTYKNAPLITDDYTELWYDEFPVLFTGLNNLRNRIVGSFVEMDKRSGNETYIHAIIDEDVYSAFINQNINYLTVLQNAEFLFLVHRLFNNDIPEIYILNFDEFPDSYRPLERSLCPSLSYSPSFSYQVALDGKKATHHEALPEDVNKIQGFFAEVLREPVKEISKLLKIQSTPMLIPATGNSFDINYRVHVQVQGAQVGFFENDLINAYGAFLKDYIRYALNDLPSDVDAILSDRFDNLKGFDSLCKTYQSLISPNEAVKPESRKDLTDSLIDLASKLNEISGTVGENYTEIKFTNEAREGKDLLGIISEHYKESIDKAVDVIAGKQGKKIEEDKKLKEYKIQIYHLNRESRKGNAIMPPPASDPDKLPRGKIIILGDEPLAETKYTESFHLDKYITVRGKAKWEGDTIRSISIEFEP